MIYRKLASAAAAAIVGTALIAAPAQGGFGGMHAGGFGGGGFGGMHAGGFGGGVGGMRVGGFGGRVGGFGGFHNGFVGRPGFVGHPGFAGRTAFVGRGFFPHNRFFFHRHFAFFPHRRFIAPFFGVGALYAASYSSCWTWVPTVFGWQRVWACDSDYGGFY